MNWDCNDVIRVPAPNGGFRVWRVIGVFPGGNGQESVVEIESLDRTKCTEGRMCIPHVLLDASIGAEKVNHPSS